MGHMHGLGLSLGQLIPDTPWVTYAYILVFYHAILGFRVIAAEKKTGISLPIGSTILTHLACVGLLIGLTVGRHSIPFFGVIRYFIPGLAPFEANWLFNGEKSKPAPKTAPADVISASAVPFAAPAAVSYYASSTGEDYEEFLKLLRAGKRPYRRPGVSVKDEYELWLAARAKSRAATATASKVQA